MAATEFYHVGIVVANLEEAMQAYSDLLGISFQAIRTPTYEMEVDGVRRETEMRVVHSVEGPPFIELIQGHRDGVFSLEHSEGLHHLGVWHDDPGVGGGTAFAGCGLPIEATFRRTDGDLLAAYTQPAALGRTRVELVNRAAF